MSDNIGYRVCVDVTAEMNLNHWVGKVKIIQGRKTKNGWEIKEAETTAIDVDPDSAVRGAFADLSANMREINYDLFNFKGDKDEQTTYS